MLISCGDKTVTNHLEYNKWLSNSNNNCKVIKEVNGMIIEVKYLPAAYLALKELNENQSIEEYNSLLNSYKNSTTFSVTFKPKEGHTGNDVMFDGVRDYKEYIERAMELNFDLESKIKLKANGQHYTPVLSSLENTYGLTKGRQVFIVFADKTKQGELENSNSMDLVYQDETYNLGILHFTFDLNSIRKKLPKIELKRS